MLLTGRLNSRTIHYMAELKTKKNTASVKAFLQSVPDEQQRQDSLALLKIFTEVSGEKATMWGTSIVGFGMYHYKSERSSQEGDWLLTGFSPRKQNLTLYVMSAAVKNPALLKKLGKCKASGGCLYIKRLSDVDISVLKELIRTSFVYVKKNYGVR